MLTKFHIPIKIIVLIGLVSVFALSAAWAVNYYSDSGVVAYGGGTNFKIVDDGNDHIKIKVNDGAADVYMDEQSISEFTLTCDLEEEYVPCSIDDYYELNFTFGPSGAHFIPELELEIKGKYVDTSCDVWLYDDQGEALEGTRYELQNKIIFKVPHFSSYAYDEYDY